MADEAIWIDCEGSGCPVHFLHRKTGGMPFFGLCAMCGEEVDAEIDGLAARHQRKDILTMIDRGDFDG